MTPMDIALLAGNVSQTCALIQQGVTGPWIERGFRSGTELLDIIALGKRTGDTFSAKSLDAAKCVEILETQPKLKELIAQHEAIREKLNTLISDVCVEGLLAEVQEWFHAFAEIIPAVFGRCMGCIPGR